MFSEKWVPPWTNLEKHPPEEQRFHSVNCEMRASIYGTQAALPGVGATAPDSAASRFLIHISSFRLLCAHAARAPPFFRAKKGGKDAPGRDPTEWVPPWTHPHGRPQGQRPFGIPFSWRCRQRKRVFPLYRYQHSLTLWAMRGMTHKCVYIAVRGFSPRALARGIHGARTDGSCNHSSRSAEVEKRYSPKIWHTQPPLTPRAAKGGPRSDRETPNAARELAVHPVSGSREWVITLSIPFATSCIPPCLDQG